MARFDEKGSISDFQTFGREVYSPIDDRLFSIWDLLTQEQRFAMRALKGIRKNEMPRLQLNLGIAFSFLIAISNRLHINIEEELWKRFPALCSYCGKSPCQCKALKPSKRKHIKPKASLKPATLAEFQAMFEAIYPSSSRSLTDAGIHLAEELGELSEAIKTFLGLHKPKQFDEVCLELADCVSCIFGVANSARIPMASVLAKMYKKNCLVCHKAPCVCSFNTMTKLKT